MSKRFGILSIFLGLGYLGLCPDVKAPDPVCKNSVSVHVTNRGGHPAEIACIEFTLESEDADPPDANRLLSKKLRNLQSALDGIPLRHAVPISSITTNSLLLRNYSIVTKTSGAEESVVISQEMALVLPNYTQNYPFESQYADFMNIVLHYTHRAQGRFELTDATALRFQETLYASTLKQAHVKAKMLLAPPFTDLSLVRIRDESPDVRIRESGAPDMYAAESIVYYCVDLQVEFSLDK